MTEPDLFSYINPTMEMKRFDTPESTNGTGIGERVLATPQTMCEAPTHLIGVQAETPLAWSADGSMVLFASENHSIYLCKYEESKEDGTIHVPITETLPTQHAQKVLDAQFHPQFPNKDEVVSCGLDGFIVWDTTNAKVRYKFPLSNNVGEEKLHTNQIECICWGYNGDIMLTGSKDNSIRIWNSGSKYEFLENLTGHKAPVLTLAFYDDTRMLASSGRDSMIKVWDMSSIAPGPEREKRKHDPSIKCNLISSMDGHRGDVCTLTWSDGGRSLLSGARDNSIKLWDCEEYKELREVTSANAHDADIRRLTYVNTTEGPLLMTAALDGCIKTWHLTDIAAASDQLTDKQMRAETELAEHAALLAIMQGEGGLDLMAEEKVKDKMMQTFRAHGKLNVHVATVIDSIYSWSGSVAWYKKSNT